MALELDELVADTGVESGHVELVYDFSGGGAGDGWLHALFRYRHRQSGHAAETSFGAHVFNTVLTYRDEPQSYTGRPPGLSTRLFLRLGEPIYDTFCHLIYPASRPWLPESDTAVILYDAAGSEIARSRLTIPCSGSRLWYYRSLFDEASWPARHSSRSFGRRRRRREPKRQGEVGSFRRRGEVGTTRTISNYAQSLGKKYAPTASNIPRRAEMGPCGAPLNV